MSEKLCVVMPVYNEQEAIGSVLEKWAKALDALKVDYVIRPYNDGSRDNSLSVIREIAKNRPRVDAHDKPNGGHGNTILTGYREAAADGFDWIFQIDSDDEMGRRSLVSFGRGAAIMIFSSAFAMDASRRCRARSSALCRAVA